MPHAGSRVTGTGTRVEVNSALDANASIVSQRIRRAVSPRLAATPDLHHDPQGWSGLPLFEAVA